MGQEKCNQYQYTNLRVLRRCAASCADVYSPLLVSDAGELKGIVSFIGA